MKLENTHDLSTPEWGPYTKKYMGISHIADKEKGIRFDLSVFPGYYRRKVDIPNVRWESGYHPWEIATDLNHYTIRHELEWKDQVYADITYSAMTRDTRLVRCHMINNTTSNQNLVLHYMASLHYPNKANSSQYYHSYQVKLPSAALWIDGLSYTCLNYGEKRHDQHLINDALRRGEERVNDFVDAKCLGKGFGQVKGDYIIYDIPANELNNKKLLMRYQMKKNEETSLRLQCGDDKVISLKGTGHIEELEIELSIPYETNRLQVTALGSHEIKIDGFVIVEDQVKEMVKFTKKDLDFQPEIKKLDDLKGLILKYEDLNQFYGIKWFYSDYQVREFHCNELDTLMRIKANNHTSAQFHGEGEGHYTNVYMGPAFLKPHEEKIIYGIVMSGTSEEDILSRMKEPYQMEQIYSRGKDTNFKFLTNKMGGKYEFSQQRMVATLLSNVVFPVYAKGEFIKHHTPGRWWDSLYTWDSGFIGIGLSDLDIERAIECLNTYVTEVGDDQTAFVHHGTPLPVQIYLLQEIWNRTQSKELMSFFYPRLKQYYEFLASSNGQSTTRVHQSNLLQTWDYFYNSGGWDDYPPQKYLTHDGRSQRKYVTPVVTTAHVIRSAKILSMIAEKMELSNDVAKYKADIALFTEALQQHSWDDEAGYYSYVIHDENGQAIGPLRYENGENYNKGLDGVSPLIAGVCTKKQEQRMMSHLKSENELWTEIGISTVDQSASYFSKEGYWNGAVWMPHQWFVWKTMLDLNELEYAWQIAETALELWKKEVEDSYHCFEHFIIESKRGAGWHQFGGLSAPVINWFTSYFCKGSLTCGFDTIIDEKLIDEDYSAMKLKLKYSRNEKARGSIIVVMDPKRDYKVYLDGVLTNYLERVKGTLEITFNKSGESGVLEITS